LRKEKTYIPKNEELRVEIIWLHHNILVAGYGCYNSKILELVNKKNLVLGLTQENSIEKSIQDCLPYILNYHGPCYYFFSLP